MSFHRPALRQSAMVKKLVPQPQFLTTLDFA
jgi:hypothetical protein